jgi:hypothetical protein
MRKKLTTFIFKAHILNQWSMEGDMSADTMAPVA